MSRTDDFTTERPTLPTGPGARPLPAVWVLQPSVRGYRVPVWDRLVRRAQDRYALSVLGPQDEISGHGYELGPHLREFPYSERQLFGRTWSTWPGAASAIRRERPAVVVFCATASILTCWTLPVVCRRLGIATVAWTKVHSRSGRRTAWTDFVKRCFYRRFDRAVCYGRASRDELLSLSNFPSEHVRIAQNTLDTDRAFAERAAIDARAGELRESAGVADAPLVVSIGRMVPRKRPLDLVEAWRRLRELSPDLRLVLVGDGPLLDDVRRRAAEVDSERIVVTGRVPPGDDEAWLGAASVVVLPGALGLAINQSVALSRPTVVADEPGSDSEIIEHKVTGWRYPRGDLDALVATVRQVLADDAQRQRVTTEATTMMRDRVTLDHMVAELDAAITDALELHAARQNRRSL